jgi:hypothetical protein
MINKEVENLVRQCEVLKEELRIAKDKLKHLEDVMQFNSNKISIGSNEEELCKIEINRLYQASKQGPLEFNEVKAFEIYVKSLMLIRGKTEIGDKKSKKSTSLTEDQLLQLALQVQDVDDTTEQ